MLSHRTVLVSAAFVLGILGAAGNAGAYVELLSSSEVTGGDATFTVQQMGVVEGTVSYHKISKSGDLQITRVSGLGGSPTTTVLTTLASWTADVGAPSNNRVFTGFGMAVTGTSLQIIDGENDQVFRVDKNTGTVSVYLSKANILSEIGGTAVTVTNWNGVSPSGEAVFFEDTTDRILQSTGPGAVTTLVTTAQLSAAQGGFTTISSGLTYDGAGNLYWGENNSDSVYKRDAGGTITAVVNPADLTPLIGGTISFNGDLFYAPDGWMYMRAGTSTNQSVLRFDPAAADPGATVQTYLSYTDLTTGPGASAFTMGFSWFDGNLSWSTTATPYYAVPEPVTLTLLCLGGLAVVRRRRG